MVQNIILFQCDQRSGRFGQGSFVNVLLPLFIRDENLNVVIVKTDSIRISKPLMDKEDGLETLLIPSLLGLQRLTGESLPAQQYYATQLAGILYEYLHKKTNLVFWINTIDYLNVCRECKALFNDLRIFYVHHSFSWKYMLNIPDDAFQRIWQNKEHAIHPKAFEMTGYQQEMALLADQVIVVTKHAKAFFTQALDIPSTKIRTIYNGVNHLPGALAEKTVLRQKYGFVKSDQIAIICGRITRDKGIPEALKAFKIVAEVYPNFKLVIIGDGYISEFVHLSEPYWSRVIYTGELTALQVREFYSLADIGLIPSLHEQCSFTAIEMSIFKLPLIVSDVDGLRELFTHQVDALKIPLVLTERGEKQIDIPEFARLIKQLIDNSDLAHMLRRNSYQKAINVFSLTKMYESYKEMLKSLATN
jgi:glycosyltransferase involved in cell wall biosynthesis